MSRSVGIWGEAQVANYLRKNRYRLVAHSYQLERIESIKNAF